MEAKQFNKITQKQIDRCLKVLEEKSLEYALDNDRLRHFKDTAAEYDISAKQALWGMLSKHLTSLNSMCRNDFSDMERWDEKITDSINYMLLLRALVEEEISNEPD